jgi:3-oxoacyl-[acyl-carrier-protein] synthase-3
MNQRAAKIISTGSYLPEHLLTNRDLEKMVATSDEWIVTRTGMKERRIAGENEFSSDMGANAANAALQQAALNPEAIDFIIVATATPDYPSVSTACLIQEAIGAKNASAMDIQAACSGYLYGIATAKAFVESGVYQNILVVASEKLSSIVNYQDRSTCVLFGDGAAACIVSSRPAKGLLINKLCLGAAGKHASLGFVPAGGCRLPASHESIDQQKHYIHMSGNEIFKHAVRKMESACKECLELASLKQSDISWLVPHQANMRIIEALAKRFDIPSERVYLTIHKYGNTSASSIGIALDELLRSTTINPKEHLLLTAFGFGLTWGAAILTYEDPQLTEYIAST